MDTDAFGNPRFCFGRLIISCFLFSSDGIDDLMVTRTQQSGDGPKLHRAHRPGSTKDSRKTYDATNGLR